jgi:uridine monophosphate synthetase
MAETHVSSTISFSGRGTLPSTPPLNAYLFHLMAIKKTNLCLSADVTTSSELLAIAEELGDSICLLKTHVDIISDISDRTLGQLKEIAERKHFLVFEDRKFGDIGSTVQKQYTAGPYSIAKWAEIATAHIFPGASVVTALKEAAAVAITTFNTRVHTEISVGTPSESVERNSSMEAEAAKLGVFPVRDSRKQSTSSSVSISTTISTRSEPMSPLSSSFSSAAVSGATDAFSLLGPIPYLRSILLLAEMSSEANFFTPEYSAKCLEVARQHPDFVLGFISQKSLNSQPGDNFLTLTPGVKLPPAGSRQVAGDGLGQQYRSPREVVLRDGADVIIVGRGILEANDRKAEAERYRHEAWSAYEARVGVHS